MQHLLRYICLFLSSTSTVWGKPQFVEALEAKSGYLDSALAEQIYYYRARAAEYDQWFLRKGRYDRGDEHTTQWFHEVEEVVSALEGFAPYGDVLELAGGTGLWTVRLAPVSDSLTVVDASPEMIEINRFRLGITPVTYIEHDIFTFKTDRKFDFVFFGFWISHVPSERFVEFWELVRSWLKPGGSFFFIDGVKDPQSTAIDHVLPDEEKCETLVRKLNDGREFRIFKIFYEPHALESRLESLGWKANVRQTAHCFIYGSGSVAG